MSSAPFGQPADAAHSDVSAGAGGVGGAQATPVPVAVAVAARWGLASRGLVYLLMGLLALVVATGGRAQVDQKGALTSVIAQPFGGALVGLIAIGLAGYALWRFSEAVFGVAGHGKEVGPRVQSLFRGAVYSFLAWTATSVLMGSRVSQGRQQQATVGGLLDSASGRVLVGLLGTAVFVAALVLGRDGWRRTFMNYFEYDELSGSVRRWVRTIGTVGTVSRACVFAIIGVLLVVASARQDESRTTGIDGAVRSLRDQPMGEALVLVISAGLVLFGIYGLAEARWRRV